MIFSKKKNHFLYLFEELLKYKFQILLAAIIIGVFGGGYYFYTSYREGVEGRAHARFVECMQYFNAKIGEDDSQSAYIDDVETFNTEQDKWTQVEKIFRESYDLHSGSGMAAMFLAFQAEALLNLQKLTEAITALKKSLKVMSISPVKNIYEVKLALMLIDGNNAEEGLTILKKLAADDNSYVADAALHHLGDFYWNKKDFVSAKNYWNQLEFKYGKQTKHPSGWANLASGKLKLIAGK